MWPGARYYAVPAVKHSGFAEAEPRISLLSLSLALFLSSGLLCFVLLLLFNFASQDPAAHRVREGHGGHGEVLHQARRERGRCGSGRQNTGKKSATPPPPHFARHFVPRLRK